MSARLTYKPTEQAAEPVVGHAEGGRREDGGGREGVCLASKGRFPVRHRRQVQRDSGPVGDRVKHRRAFPARAAAVAVAADAAFGPTD